MPVRCAISRCQVVRSSIQNLFKWSWPQARAITCINSVAARKKLLPQMRLLRGDADRAVVGVAGAHTQAADRLNRCIGYGDGISTQCHGLDKICRQAQATGNHQADIAAATLVKILSLNSSGAAPVPPPRPSRMI